MYRSRHLHIAFLAHAILCDVLVFASSEDVPLRESYDLADDDSLSLLQAKTRVSQAENLNEPPGVSAEAGTAEPCNGRSGKCAALSDEGYKMVTMEKDDENMAEWISRYCQSVGLEVENRGDLAGFAHAYLSDGSLSFDRMKAELTDLANKGTTWVLRTQLDGGSLPIVESSYWRLLKHDASVTEISHWMRRVLHDHAAQVVDNEKLRIFVGDLKAHKPKYLDAIRMLEAACHEQSWIQSEAMYQLHRKDFGVGVGASAPLDQSGFAHALLGGTDEMLTFMKRLCQKLNLVIDDEGTLRGFADYYTKNNKRDPTLNFDHAWKELLSISRQPDGWGLYPGNVTGENAPLNERGFRAVQGQNHSQIAAFVRRILAEQGGKIVNEGELQGFGSYYSEWHEEPYLHFHHIMDELRIVTASPTGWAQLVQDGNANYTGKTAPLTEEGYKSIQRAGAHEMAEFVRRVIEEHDSKVINEANLNGFSAYYSGFLAQPLSFKGLVDELGRISTDPSGWVKPLHTYTGSQGTIALFNKEIARAGRTPMQMLTVDSEDADGVKIQGPYGSIHDVVGREGILQIGLEADWNRDARTTGRLLEAGIVPNRFFATDARSASTEQLRQICPLASESTTKHFCESRRKVGPGCRTKIEQAITDSHRRALLAALERQEEWTAIIEDDVVPVHPEQWDDDFKKAWDDMDKEQFKFVRLGWCTFEGSLGYKPAPISPWWSSGNFKLINQMYWKDSQVGWFDWFSPKKHYYTGGCTTGYMVHKQMIPELLSIFPCCCPIDCCMEQHFFNAPSKGKSYQFRGEEAVMHFDHPESRQYSDHFTTFNQSGVLVQDNRDLQSNRGSDWTWEIAD